MYEQFYGFSERPFQLTPDPAFFFESVTHKKALSYLGYGLNQGEGFIVITGEVGAGKSTLVGHLRNRIDAERVTIGEVVTSGLDGDAMITMAAHSFGFSVPSGDKAAALTAIEIFLHEEARAGRKVMLIVDEAQNLSVGALEELRMLSNFHLGSQSLLQMVLLGQPEFRQLLEEWDELEQIRQRVIAAHHLEAMQPEEIEQYVTHRLQHVGWVGNPSFEPAIWTRIYEQSRGIPRLVNRLMSRLLMRGAARSQSRLDVALFDAVVAEMHGGSGSAPTRKQPVNIGDQFAPEEVEAPQADQPTPQPGEAQPGLLDAQIEAIETAFAEHEKAIADLREEIGAIDRSPAPQQSGDTDARLSAIEARLDEQERSLRHVLSMMIDFYESDGSRNAA